MKYFANIKTLDELKAQYRRLAMQYHPDRGGSTEIMQQINAEYERLHERLKAQHNAEADEYHQTTETAAEFIEIINALIKLSGLVVELCGSWLWIGGETKAHKDELKAMGCRWSQKKAYGTGGTKRMGADGTKAGRLWRKSGANTALRCSRAARSAGITKG